MQDQITYKYKFDRTDKFYSCTMLIKGKQIELLANGNDEPKLLKQCIEGIQLDLVDKQRQKLKEFKDAVDSLNLEMNDSNFAVLYSHSTKGDKTTLNHLSFEIDESHVVSINDYFMAKQFGDKDQTGSYKVLYEQLLDQSDYPTIKFSTHNAVILEEQIEIENSNCKYLGFKDKEPYDKHHTLFETTRTNFQTIINGIIKYRTEMKN